MAWGALKYHSHSRKTAKTVPRIWRPKLAPLCFFSSIWGRNVDTNSRDRGFDYFSRRSDYPTPKSAATAADASAATNSANSRCVGYDCCCNSMYGHAFGARRTKARHVTKFVPCTQTMSVKRMLDLIVDVAAAAGAAAADSPCPCRLLGCYCCCSRMSGDAFGAQWSTVRHVTKFVPCMQSMTVKCKV